MTRPGVKQDLICRIEQMLNVAGTATPWPDIAEQLEKMTASSLSGLRYRIERALENSFNEGAEQEHAVGALP